MQKLFFSLNISRMQFVAQKNVFQGTAPENTNVHPGEKGTRLTILELGL